MLFGLTAWVQPHFGRLDPIQQVFGSQVDKFAFLHFIDKKKKLGMENYGDIPSIPDQVDGRILLSVCCSNHVREVLRADGCIPVLAFLTDLIFLDSPEAFPHEPSQLCSDWGGGAGSLCPQVFCLSRSPLISCLQLLGFA